MNETKRRLSAVLVLTGILILGALVLFTGVASAQEMTPEELFESLSGGWDFEGNMTIGEQTMPVVGTRTDVLTGPTSADFVMITAVEGGEEVEVVKAWWNATMEKLAIKEGEEEPMYYDLLENGYGATYELEGIPEMGITENVTCQQTEIFVDEDTLVHSWVARNATGIVVASWEGTFTRTDVWHVVEGISIQDAIDNAADGDTVIVHDDIYEEQLYIAKSIDLKAAEGESPEIRAPEMLESYSYDHEMFPGWTMLLSVTPVIMVNGSSDDINVNISGFIIDGSSVTPENSEYGITGILYYNADGIIEDNEIKNIWGVKEEEEGPPYPWDGNAVFALSESNIVIHRNNIHNYTGVESCGILIFGIGLVKNPVEAMVTKNIVTGARSPESPDQMGISIYGAIATVNGNIVSGHIYTEDMWYASGMSIIDTNLTAQGNTLIGGGILVNTGCGYPHSMAFIKNNTVDVSRVYEEESGPFAGVAITTYPPVFAAYDPSVTATVEDNQFIGGPGSGIVIGGIGAGVGVEPVGTVTSTITRNIVSGWDCGIELLKCSNSTVYLNDFVDNTQSVSVKNSTNLWNSTSEMNYLYSGEGYTNHLGNHWSDYTGSDSDGDGIGDAAYTITGDNPDSYPLVETYENYRLSITPEELFESLAGEWTFEGSMIVGNDTIPISGTRTFTLTGSTSADFVVEYKMGDTEATETGSAWWDDERKQLAIKEGDEIGYSNLTINGFESREILEDGVPELGISEKVISEERVTILDDTTHTSDWSAVNMNGETLVSGKLTFKPVAPETATTLTAEVIPAISMTITTTGVDFGKVGTGMTSENQVITVVNTGAGAAKVSAMILDDSNGFYNESLRLNGLNIGVFSGVVPADTSDFRYEYEVVANLVVPDWAGGTYDGTIFFVAESA